MKKLCTLAVILFMYAAASACHAGDQEEFYGHWIIKKAITSGPVSRYDDAGIRSLLGKEVDYSRNAVRFGQSAEVRPYYEKTPLGEDDFWADYKISLEQLEIKTHSIVQVEVYTEKELENLWDSPASIILIKGPDALIMFDGGDFFELVRKK